MGPLLAPWLTNWSRRWANGTVQVLAAAGHLPEPNTWPLDHAGPANSPAFFLDPDRGSDTVRAMPASNRRSLQRRVVWGVTATGLLVIGLFAFVIRFELLLRWDPEGMLEGVWKNTSKPMEVFGNDSFNNVHVASLLSFFGGKVVVVRPMGNFLRPVSNPKDFQTRITHDSIELVRGCRTFMFKLSDHGDTLTIISGRGESTEETSFRRLKNLPWLSEWLDSNPKGRGFLRDVGDGAATEPATSSGKNE